MQAMTKTFTFAFMHFGIAFSVAYLLTGDVIIGGAVMGMSVVGLAILVVLFRNRRSIAVQELNTLKG